MRMINKIHSKNPSRITLSQTLDRGIVIASQLTNPLKECNVVVEDVSCHIDAEKLKALKNGPVNLHSTSSRLDDDRKHLNTFTIKQFIKWPQANETWGDFDGAVLSKLNRGCSLSHRLDILQSTIYDTAVHKFGYAEQRQNSSFQTPSRRKYLSLKLVSEKNTLIAKIESCMSFERPGLQVILAQVKTKLRSLRRSERNRKKRWRFKNANIKFKRNPYQAGKDLLDPKCHIKLSIGKETLDRYLSSIIRDQLYDVPLVDLPGLPPPPTIKTKFSSKGMEHREFIKLLQSRRNGSAPGINKIPYKVYKNCPQIASFLFDILKSCYNKDHVPIQWRLASQVYIPKVKPPKEEYIEDFRMLGLLNVEGKLFFSLISNQLTQHMVKNKSLTNLFRKVAWRKCQAAGSIWQWFGRD